MTGQRPAVASEASTPVFQLFTGRGEVGAQVVGGEGALRQNVALFLMKYSASLPSPR